MSGPFGSGQAIAGAEEFEGPGLVAEALVRVDGPGAFEGPRRVAKRDDRVMKRGLIGFHLHDQPRLGAGGRLESS
jgi:hypothetical protein